MENKIILLGFLIFAFVCNPCYPRSVPERIRTLAGAYKPDQGPPRPFRFSYSNQIDFGSTSYHEAQGDETGTVRGRYGYTDADGVYRTVQYEADANGYRATVLTNEPGTEEKNPADVVMVVEPVPQSVINRYGGQKPFAGPPKVVPGSTSGRPLPSPPPSVAYDYGLPLKPPGR